MLGVFMYLSFVFITIKYPILITLYGIRAFILYKFDPLFFFSLPASHTDHTTHPMAFFIWQTSILNADNTNTNNHIVQFNPSSQLPIKLQGSSNFSTSKAQLMLLLDGHELTGHLNSSTLCLTKTITRDNTSEINPVYRLWVRRDRLIHQAMMACIHHRWHIQ